MSVTTKLSALLLTAALGTSAAAEDMARTIPPAPANTQTTSASGISVGISVLGGSISFKAAPVIAPNTSSVDFSVCSGSDQGAVKACEDAVIENRREIEKRRIMGEPVNINAALKAAIAAPCYSGPNGCQDHPEKTNLEISRFFKGSSAETDSTKAGSVDTDIARKLLLGVQPKKEVAEQTPSPKP